ncbi:PREDICTED: auxin-induced protein 6B [Lupinus angustifolius]|uniref:auxin-induced protein 6B n=1 Tax=Lupinus angustifolius TaxID=3871 RepID=UPI00092F7A13|nr:PREDICTED: auxin-induced protein 6B [Lupinus angustifolius]
MKLATISIPTPRIITSPLKLTSYSSYHVNAVIGRKKKIHKYKPLLVDGEESSDGSSSRDSRRNNKVPKGFLAVYVGPESKRFVIPISFLSMPDFRVLMDMVAEEFGCDHHGALHFPCDEQQFQQILVTCFSIQRMLSSKN